MSYDAAHFYLHAIRVLILCKFSLYVNTLCYPVKTVFPAKFIPHG